MKHLLNGSLVFLGLLGVAFSMREAMLGRELSQRYQKAVDDIKHFDNFSRAEIISLCSLNEENAEDGILIAPLSSLDQWHFRWRVFVPEGESFFTMSGGEFSGPGTLVFQARFFESRTGLRSYVSASGIGTGVSVESNPPYVSKARLEQLEFLPLCSTGPVLVGPDEANVFLECEVAADLANELELSQSDQIILWDCLFSTSYEAMNDTKEALNE